MNRDDYAKWAHRAVDWSVNYLETVSQRPVRAPVAPGDILAQLAPSPPEQGEAMEKIFADFENQLLPGMTHWQHPRFFAYFPANSSPPSLIAEQLTATLAAQCMLWQTSPAATELEIRVIDWLRQMIGLPASFSGCIQDSASSATLCAILTARERALNWHGNAQGLSGQPPIRIYCADQVHSSIDKAMWVAGLGQANLVKLPTGAGGAMDVRQLDAAISADRRAGYLPAGIVACIGSTSVGASDDIAAVAAVAQHEKLYLHVDAAWAGAAMICAEFRHMMAGAELADSFVFNPHKWLFTNFDCSAHFVREPNDLMRTLAIKPDYLKTDGQDGVINFSEWSVPLGRRFRALKLWFVIRAYGVEKLRDMLRRHITWAGELAASIDQSADFELTSDPVLSLFTFRYAPRGAHDLDALNAGLHEAINDDGRIYLTKTRHQGNTVIRFQVGQTDTTSDDVALAWEVIRQIAAGLESSGSS